MSRWRFEVHSLRARVSALLAVGRAREGDSQFGGVGVAGADVAGLQLLELLGGAEFVGHDEAGGGGWRWW